MSRRAPRRLASAVAQLTTELAPATLLADVQRVWGETVGPAVAKEAVPVGEHGGVVSVRCSSAVWAQELALLAPPIVQGLNQRLEGAQLRGLRCRVA